jgi:hypothetical protein
MDEIFAGDDKLYKKMYLSLFNEVTEVIEVLRQTDDPPQNRVTAAQALLRNAQRECEDIFIEARHS